MPIASYTQGPTQVALSANTPVPVAAARSDRVGAFITNGTALATVYLSIGPVDPTSKRYSWKLGPGEQVMLPLYSAVQEIRAMAPSLIAVGDGFCITEFDLTP